MREGEKESERERRTIDGEDGRVRLRELLRAPQDPAPNHPQSTRPATSRAVASSGAEHAHRGCGFCGAATQPGAGGGGARRVQ